VAGCRPAADQRADEEEMAAGEDAPMVATSTTSASSTDCSGLWTVFAAVAVAIAWHVDLLNPS
jgi:hypothetical protein